MFSSDIKIKEFMMKKINKMKRFNKKSRNFNYGIFYDLFPYPITGATNVLVASSLSNVNKQFESL